MAETSALKEVTGKLTERLFSGVFWFGLAIIIIGIAAFLMWYFLHYRKQFDIEVTIKSRRAGEKNSILKDKAAILIDRKTKSSYLRVWNLKRDFTVPRYEALQKTNKGDMLEMYRKGEDEFYFLLPSKINRTIIKKNDGKYEAYAEQEQILLDPEMAYWAAKRKSQNKKMFDTDSFLMKLIPFIPQILGGVFMIFILYILLDHLPGILSQLKSLVAQMNQMQMADVTTG